MLSLGGTLNISLLNGFMPSNGSYFYLLIGALSGTFNLINLPSLQSLLAWDTSRLYTTGVLAVVPALPGDFNVSGTVDAADYVVWCKGSAPRTPHLTTTSGGPDFGHFCSGSGVTANTAVPEPTTFVLLTLAAAGWNLCRRRIK